VANLDIFLSYISHGYGPSASRDFWIRFDFPDKADGARPETGRDNAWKFAHPYHEPLPANLAPTKLIQARFHDVTPFIDEMRNIKTPQEIEVLRAMEKSAPKGIRKRSPTRARECISIKSKPAPPVTSWTTARKALPTSRFVSSGTDINTIHYFADRHKIEANQLVVLDFAASLDHMTMDITRTFNISGKFTPEQAKWYAVELEAQKTTVALLTPGHTYEEASDAGKAIY
jgi:Xaa-Pro aminopeptidase